MIIDEKAGRGAAEAWPRHELQNQANGRGACRAELDPFKVVVRFTIADQQNGKAASEAFKALQPQRGDASGSPG